jgi:hypothetical protein
MNRLLLRENLVARSLGACALAVGVGSLTFSAPALAQDKYATAEELKFMEGFPAPPDKRVTRASTGGFTSTCG